MTWKLVSPSWLLSVPGGGPEGRPRLAVLVYRRDMPGRKRPTPEDAMTARRALLDGLARDADIFEVLNELAPLHPRNDTFPGEVFLHLAADALEWCGASRAEPLPLEGLRERFLPECAFRGRQNAKLQYAVLAAAAVHGGTDPDLLEEVAYVADRRLLAVRHVRGGRLHPRRRQPGGRPGAPGMPGSGREPWRPDAIALRLGALRQTSGRRIPSFQIGRICLVVLPAQADRGEAYSGRA